MPPVSQQQFGLEIRLLREQRNLSAKDLAERIGLSPSQMSRLESGQRRVDALLLSKIARALDVHPSHFFAGFEGRAEPEPAPEASRPAEAELGGVASLSAVPSQVGRLIRAERRRRHLTAEELGQRVGKGKAFIQDLEEARTDLVSGETLLKIARALKLAPEALIEAQRADLRELRRSLRRLERAHTERTLGDLQLEGPGAVKRGLPLVEAEDGGLPLAFDQGAPEGRVIDYLYFPGLRAASAFAVRWAGESMQRAQEPSFREGDILVFDPSREARHQDFVLALLPGQSLFRQLYLDPKGRVRLQPLNYDHAPVVAPRDEVQELFPLVARLQTI